MTLLSASESNPALRVLYRWFFDHIQVDDAWVKQVRTLSQRGRIVYVLRSLNAVDYLALDHLTKRFDLPRIQYVNDPSLGLLEPLNRGIYRFNDGVLKTKELYSPGFVPDDMIICDATCDRKVIQSLPESTRK